MELICESKLTLYEENLMESFNWNKSCINVQNLICIVIVKGSVCTHIWMYLETYIRTSLQEWEEPANGRLNCSVVDSISLCIK